MNVRGAWGCDCELGDMGMKEGVGGVEWEKIQREVYLCAGGVSVCLHL